MSAVTPADSTVVAIRKKIRRLTSSSSESTLTTANIDQAINTAYNNDFPYGIKIDQMRSVYTFFTEPNRDRYPLDVNYAQGVRAPFYVEGIQGTFMKDRQQFYNVWPRFPFLFQQGGTTSTFSFTVPGPFLSKEVVIGGVDNTGAPISINDDGKGRLLLQNPNAVVTTPPYTAVYTALNAPEIALIGKPIPGMHNQNTLNPGLNKQTDIGSVDYVTGVFLFTLPGGMTLLPGTLLTVWVSQYQTGRPYSCLFWNNEFTIRPVPERIHKCEIEVFLTPVAFMQSSDSPILNQWWQYIAYIAAMEILRERQDTQGVEQLREGMMRQEALVLERQGIEEIFQPNIQLFNSTTSVYGGVNGIGYY